jgi:hypothetical protein
MQATRSLSEIQTKFGTFTLINGLWCIVWASHVQNTIFPCVSTKALQIRIT